MSDPFRGFLIIASGQAYFPSLDGKESAADNIFRNEISSIIEYVLKAPQHDQEKGLFLIGSSMGSWFSLLTVRHLQEKISGVVFVSPAIVEGIVESEIAGYDVVGYSKSLFSAYGNRPGLVIGAKGDLIGRPGIWKNQSTLDGANLLRQRIGSNIEVFEVASSAHGEKLIETDEQSRTKIVTWLESKVK